MADRFDKALIARRLKLAEIGASGVAVVGFMLQSVPVLFVALAAFGIIAAVVGLCLDAHDAGCGDRARGGFGRRCVCEALGRQ